MSSYMDKFSKRMAMAGIKPHHRIALGVSGGPDSIAMCLLAANWKANGTASSGERRGFIDGILAVIVDHGLRGESEDEANCVSTRVSEMGIRCEIARCEWLDGRPKKGHLQEAARERRYQLLQNVCLKHHIGVLLIAHHADDQAELFILRLSRNSGVYGLACMAFTSQLFSMYAHLHGEHSNSRGILLVRPLLDFSKQDLYKICQEGHQEWVEDPTNRSPLYARNRIRMSLNNLSGIFKNELQALISTCRKTRSYVDRKCRDLIDQTLTITDLGYAVIDLEMLNQSNIEAICLSKFMTLVLQFISQRNRPVRGSTSKLLLDYIRTLPCKISITAAGCYLSPAPGSKGTKVVVCCSVNSIQPSGMKIFPKNAFGKWNHYIPSEVEQIIKDGKSYSDYTIPNPSAVYFLDTTSCESVLIEAKKLNIINKLTHENLLLLQKVERERFLSKSEVSFESKLKNVEEHVNESLQPGKICYFMNRFFVTWILDEKICGESQHCRRCLVGNDSILQVKHMVDADWLYLAKLSKSERVLCCSKTEEVKEDTNVCLDYMILSAQRALSLLKAIPVAARRGLPVIVDSQGHLLSIPSIGFRHCPCLMVSAEFKPRVPLGGGHSSFV